MFRKDTFRMIKKTSKRFISLVLIVLIGSGFMMGLMSSATILQESMDTFNDDYNLQDIQIYSNYGFCKEDIEEIKKTEGVKDIFASRFVDVYAKGENEKEIVARVEELNRDVNKYKLVEGRLPQNSKECLMIVTSSNNTSYQLGETIKVYLDDEDELNESLRNDEFTIVGFAQSPAYTSKILGTSTLKSADLNVSLLVDNANFISSQYKTIYLTLEGASDKLSYSNDYDNLVSNLKDNLNSTAFRQQSYYRDIVVEKATLELNENKEKFEEEKANGQKQLDEAKQQLDDAHIQIVSYQTQITSLNTAINEIDSTINSYQKTLDSRKAELGVSDEQVRQEIENFNDIDVKKILTYIGAGLDSFIHSTDNIYELAILQKTIDEANETLATYKGKVASLNYQISVGQRQYEDGLQEYNNAVLKFNDEIEKAEAEIKKAEQTIIDLPNATWTILDRDSHYSSYMFKATVKQMSAIGYSFPLLFYLVAALVCMTTMTRLVDEQRGQIGIFRALGYSKKQVIGKYVTYAFLASVVGSIIGIVLGQLIFPTVIYNAWKLMYLLPDMKLSYPIVYVLICFFAFSLLMMFVTYLVAKKDLNEVPACLLRPKAPKVSKPTLIEKIPFIWDNLSFTSKITARNLIRYKSRFFMTIIGVAGCTGLLVVGFGIKDSVKDIVQIQYGNIFNYDYEIKLENDYHLDSNIEVLKEDSNNTLVIPFMSYTSSVSKDDEELDGINVEVIDAGNALEILNLRKTDKKTILNIKNNGVIISEKYAKNNNLKKGDMITIEDKNGVLYNVEIADICEMYFQHYLFMSSDYYETITNTNVHNTSIAIKTIDSSSLESDIKKLEDYSSTSDFLALVEQFETMIKALDFIILVIILAAGSLAFVVLFNLTQVNVSERTREIATLKVLGFRPKEVDSYIFKEIMILSVIGGIIGFPLGLIEHHFVMNVINMDMIMFGMNISMFSYFISFVITFIFTLIVLFKTKKPLRQIEMVESLKSVE